jgi:hypothetical protein
MLPCHQVNCNHKQAKELLITSIKGTTMFGKVKKPVAPILPEPELDSTAEYVAQYNEAWEKFYDAQDAYEAKNLQVSGL